jgi:hypothetical protein
MAWICGAQRAPPQLRSTAACPTFWWARAPAKGMVAAPSSSGRHEPSAHYATRESEGEEEKLQMALGFGHWLRLGVFVLPKLTPGRRIRMSGCDQTGRLSAQVGESARPESQPRPRLRPGRRGARRARLGRFGAHGPRTGF